MLSLAEHSAAFAEEIQGTLDSVLPGDRTIISRRFEDTDRYLVAHNGETARERRMPLYVGGEHLADLGLALYLDLDRTGRYLKTVQSEVSVHSVLDRTPLVRYEYRADMHTDPIAHWQVHAERGAMSHLLGRAHATNPAQVKKPHDMSSLHFPVGGERFRPCLEDVLQFLVVDCGVDSQQGWLDAVCDGRERWRRRQIGSAVRDVPAEAARILTELGWTVTPPENPRVRDHPETLRKW